jgi:hypothetical protein
MPLRTCFASGVEEGLLYKDPVVRDPWRATFAANSFNIDYIVARMAECTSHEFMVPRLRLIKTLGPT